MANIVVTTTTNSVKVDFGDYSPTPLQMTKGAWRKSYIASITQDSVIRLTVTGEHTWSLSVDGAEDSFIIDSVDGVAPTDNDDLYTKLSALIT